MQTLMNLIVVNLCKPGSQTEGLLPVDWMYKVLFIMQTEYSGQGRGIVHFVLECFTKKLNPKCEANNPNPT